MIESYILIGINLAWILVTIFVMSVVFIKLKGNWVHKAICIIFLSLSVFSSIKVWNEIQGSPKPTTELNEFIVRSYLIQEPTSKERGKIWLWGFYPDEIEPKNILIPYSKKIHEQLMNNEAMSQGRPQKFQRLNDSTDIDGHELVDINPFNLPKD